MTPALITATIPCLLTAKGQRCGLGRTCVFSFFKPRAWLWWGKNLFVHSNLEVCHAIAALMVPYGSFSVICGVMVAEFCRRTSGVAAGTWCHNFRHDDSWYQNEIKIRTLSEGFTALGNYKISAYVYVRRSHNTRVRRRDPRVVGSAWGVGGGGEVGGCKAGYERSFFSRPSLRYLSGFRAFHCHARGLTLAGICVEAFLVFGIYVRKACPFFLCHWVRLCISVSAENSTVVASSACKFVMVIIDEGEGGYSALLLWSDVGCLLAKEIYLVIKERL